MFTINRLNKVIQLLTQYYQFFMDRSIESFISKRAGFMQCFKMIDRFIIRA